MHPIDNTAPQTLRLLNYQYGMALKPLHFTAYQARMLKIDPERIALAEDLIGLAQQYDIRQTLQLITTPFNGTIPRDLVDPTDYTHPSIIGQPWADDADQPLTWGENWNKGRRATNTHDPYTLDTNKHPVNPYLNYGVKGRGVIGRFGPNHAVDNGILSIRPNAAGKPALHALGIIRQDNDKPALCGGFIEFHTPLRYAKHDMVETQTQEFFEELVSGSVELLPEYAVHVTDEVTEAIRNRENLTNRVLSDQQKTAIEKQIITHHKLQQVKERDPLFLENVHSLFETAQDCYAGPVLDSGRNTNNAWMETRLSWFMLDDETWRSVKGEDKFHYDFKAGDDAQQVLWHEITPELVQSSTGGHGAFFTYLLSAYLLTSEQEDAVTLNAIKAQAATLSTFYRDTAKTHAPVP